MLVGRSVAPRRPRDVYTRIKSHMGASSERLFSTRGMEPEAPNKGPSKEFSEEPISEGPKPKCPDSSKSRKNSLPSSLTLRSLFAKRIQRQRSGLPCKLRFLKYPHSPNQRTTKILSLLSDHQTWDMDTQKALDALEIKLSWKVVREVIKSLSNVPIAVGFFRWAAQQKDFKHNTKTYSAIARLVGESGDLKLMHSLLQQMHTEGCALTPYFLADIMMAYGSLNMVKEAYLVFKEMNSAGCPPNQFVYNCLISILMRGGYLEGAKKVCNMMWNIGGCQPDTITYNMLIDNHGKSGNILKAQQYCFEMKQRGIRPNEKSYASLIGSLRKDGKIEKACEIFHEIKGKGWLVNRVTYTELIRGLGRAGKVEKALEVFREMEDSRCTFDVVVYNIMLDILVKQRLVTEAWKIFVSMQAKQCFPNVVTYNSLIHGFCMAKRMDEAFRWYDGMKREGIDPDDHTHAILISGFCKLGQWDAAYKFLMEKENDFVVNERVPRIKGDDQAGCCGEGVIMSVAVHNAMLDGFVKAGELEIACAHFRVMEEKGCFPDVFSYSIIIHGLGNAGKAKDASEMYKKMKESGLIPNLVTFNTLINVLGKAGMIFEVHEIVHEMLSLGLKPDIITYTSLLSIVGKDSKGFQKQKVAAVKCRFDHVLGISNINQ